MAAEGDAPKKQEGEKAEGNLGESGGHGTVDHVCGDEDFCRQVSTTFPFLSRDQMTAMNMCCKMHTSVCKVRFARESASKELCPILKFASHAFSASLVQGRIDELLGDVEELRAELEAINEVCFGVSSDLVGQTVSPEMKDHGIPIANVAEKLSRNYQRGEADEPLHLLKVNERLKAVWMPQPLEWDKFKKECDDRVKNQTPVPTGGWFVALAAVMAEVSIGRLAHKDDDSGAYQVQLDYLRTCIREAVAFLRSVEERLSDIKEGIRREHEKAYTQYFSPTAPYWRENGLAYHGFQAVVHAVAGNSGMWNPVPLAPLF